MNEITEFKGNNIAKRENAMAIVESSRAVQEVQAAMVIAKKFGRDQTEAYNRIIQACKRQTLAKTALYAYPRGGQMVTGPSIRLAETLAQAWGNIQFGIRELSQENGVSEIEAFAWDLETNTRQVKVFKAKHERDTRSGPKKLTGSRDVYELVANQGARRLRACILGVIPGDIVEAAVEQCEKTLANENGKPLIDRVRGMVAAFAELGVDQKMIENRIGHKIDATNATELVSLAKIYQSIKDGMSDRKDFFEIATTEKTTEDITKKISKTKPDLYKTTPEKEDKKDKEPGK